MGKLDAQSFEKAVAGCSKCEFKAFDVSAYLDRTLSVMVAKSNNDGRWTFDDAKFFDGVFRIQCLSCKTLAFDSADCPICHRANGLADVGVMSRLVVPSRCPECSHTEMTLTTFAPAVVKEAEHQRAAPTQLAFYGDAGYHVATIACEPCGWTQRAAGCAVCGGPGPLRARP
jgi:hypothetical protein